MMTVLTLSQARSQRLFLCNKTFTITQTITPSVHFLSFSAKAPAASLATVANFLSRSPTSMAVIQSQSAVSRKACRNFR